jgi:hypothetical protein
MKPAPGRPFSAIENHGIAIPVSIKVNRHFKRLLTCKRPLFINLLFFLMLFSVSALRLNAQEIKKTSSGANYSKTVILRIKGLSDEKFASTVESVLSGYPGKILSHAFDKSSNEVSVVISDRLQPVDLLEVLEMNGINAGYLNDKKELIVLDDGGELTEPITITK